MKFSFVSDYIIERKILSDLTQSIIDGRYKEQKSRLSKSGLEKVVYLVEGSRELLSHMGESSIFSLKLFSNFIFLRTVDIKESIYRISSIHK